MCGAIVLMTPVTVLIDSHELASGLEVIVKDIVSESGSEKFGEASIETVVSSSTVMLAIAEAVGGLFFVTVSS